MNLAQKKTTIFWVSLGVLFLLVIVFKGLPAIKNSNLKTKYDNGFSKVYSRVQLQKEGQRFAKQFKFKKALESYQKSLDPALRNFEWQQGPAWGGIKRVYTHLGSYDKALQALTWHLKVNPKQFEHEQRELTALKKYREFGDPSSVYEHIDYMKRRFPTAYPPQNAASNYTGLILHLYGVIGDPDAGIEFIDECLSYFKKIDIEKYGEYQPGRADAAYLKVREAFERDKAEGFKGCAGVPAGEVCMGHATRALIQSDYFPW